MTTSYYHNTTWARYVEETQVRNTSKMFQYAKKEDSSWKTILSRVDYEKIFFLPPHRVVSEDSRQSNSLESKSCHILVQVTRHSGFDELNEFECLRRRAMIWTQLDISPLPVAENVFDRS